MRRLFGLGSDADAGVGNYLSRGTLLALLLQLSAAGLTLLGSMMLAWFGGGQQFGIYSIVFGWVNVLGIPALLGLNDLLIRELSVLRSLGAMHRARQLVHWAMGLATIATFVVVAVFALGVHWGNWFGLAPYAHLFDLALLTVPMFVFLHLGQAVFLGAQRIASGQTTEKLIKPLVFVLLLLGCWQLGIGLNDHLMVGLQVLAFVPSVASLAVMLYFFYKSLPQTNPTEQDRSRIPNRSGLLKSSFYFMLAGSVQVLCTRIDLLIVGAFMVNQPEQAGYYNVAARYSELLLMPFVALNTVTAPLYAGLFAAGDHKSLQKIYTRTTRLLFALTLLGTLCALLLGPMAMRWFGKDFGEGYASLCWLALGQLCYAFSGTAGQVLLMTGKERLALTLQGSSLLVAVAAHMILIPRFGITGAGMATAIGFAAHNALLFVVSPRSIGLRPGIF